MIAATPLPGQFDASRADWRRALAEAIRDPAELCAVLGLDPALIAPALAAAKDFPLVAPRSFVARMRPGDPRDPLLMQVLPLAAELDHIAGFIDDPVGDLASRSARGLLHKYHGRALLVATGACAVHCRYCFRRRFPYAEESPLHEGWREAIEHIRSDTSITEVILSGGDPLSLTDRRLAQLTDALSAIDHVRRVRLHTRLPVVLPERVDAGLLAWLANAPQQKVVVIHANHAREIDPAVARACAGLRDAGALVLNQSVLLAGINDTVEALTDLSESLFAAGVTPYYLHLLDKVRGAAHFDVPAARAIELHAAITARLPGYLVPRLVREIPGEPAKTPIRGFPTPML